MVDMTPRLRNLLIGLGISLAIMIFDQFSKSSDSSSSKPARKPKIQRPKKVVSQNSTQTNNTPKLNNYFLLPFSFLKIFISL